EGLGGRVSLPVKLGLGVEDHVAGGVERVAAHGRERVHRRGAGEHERERSGPAAGRSTDQERTSSRPAAPQCTQRTQGVACETMPTTAAPSLNWITHPWFELPL